MGVLYRIVTEGINAENIRAILSAHGLDYSMFAGGGAYKGTPEKTIMIDLLFVTRERAAAAARDIGRANNQECVLLMAIPCEAEFISTSDAGAIAAPPIISAYGPEIAARA